MSSRGKRSSSNARAPRGKRGSNKNDQFVLNHAQQLVSTVIKINQRTNRPRYESKGAAFNGLKEIVEKQICRSRFSRFKNKGCSQMARRVVQFVIDGKVVKFADCPEAKGYFAPEVTRLSETFVDTRSRFNHPAGRDVFDSSEMAA